MKLLHYLTLKLILKDPVVTAKVYKILFEDEFSYQEPKQVKLNNATAIKPTTVKKSENDLQRTLRELKLKTNKSKKDKESIGILEAVIKNGHNSFS
jgi:4-diphosphocytidyl-2C-methyl-D-erythritol kinase